MTTKRHLFLVGINNATNQATFDFFYSNEYWEKLPDTKEIVLIRFHTVLGLGAPPISQSLSDALQRALQTYLEFKPYMRVNRHG